MATPAAAPASDLERRKKVRVRMRRDLSITPQKYEGRTYYVVKDPVSLRYYRFKEQEHFLINMMDGSSTLDEAQKAFEQRFRPERLTLEDLEGFAQQLLTAGLAQNESQQAGKLLYDRRKKRRRSEWLQTLTNILYIKIPLYDPDKLLTRMLSDGLFPKLVRGPIQVLFAAYTAFCLVVTPVALLALVVARLGITPPGAAGFLERLDLRNLMVMWAAWAGAYVVYRVSKDLRFIFTLWFVFFSVALWSAALLLIALHFQTFTDKLPSYHEFFTFKNVMLLWVALGAVKIIHEFGHGLSCKAYGGEVHEMGLLFLVFSPCLYCNVSDAWTLPSKWKRIIISAAGIWVELCIAAIATFVWWNTPSNPGINNMALSLMIVCSVSTVIFNANPLMRYDGYYILADWLEIPNLRDRSNRYLQRLVMEHCMGIEVPPEQYMALWRRVLFVIYAIISWVYRWVITFTILWFMASFLGPKLKVISQMLAVASAGSLVGWPLYRLGKGLHKRGRLPDMKPVRVAISLAVVFVILVCFFTVPLPVSRVRQTALVQIDPEHVWKVTVQHSGILTEINCKDGELVQEGAILARLRSFELEQELAQAGVQALIHGKRASAYNKLLQESSDLTTQDREELDRKVSQARSESELYSLKKRELAQAIDKMLTLRAERAGVVLSPPRIDEIGRYWDAKEQSRPFCSIGDPKKLRVVMPVSPDDYNLLVNDRKALQVKGQDLGVTVRIQGRDSQTWAGTVTELPQSAAKEVPIQLTTRAGGPLAIKPNPKNPNALEPQAQQYLVAIEVKDPDDAISPGAFAQAKIHCQWRSCGWWTWRSFASLFDLGMEPTDLLPRLW